MRNIPILLRPLIQDHRAVIVLSWYCYILPAIGNIPGYICDGCTEYWQERETKFFQVLPTEDRYRQEMKGMCNTEGEGSGRKSVPLSASVRGLRTVQPTEADVKASDI